MLKTIILTISILIIPILTNAQYSGEFCGSHEGRSEWLKAYQQNPVAMGRDGDTLWIPLQFHIAGTDEGEGYFDEQVLRAHFCELNEQYGPSEIQFFMRDDINYVNNNTLYFFNTANGAFDEVDNLEQTYLDRLNIIIVDSLSGNCGIAILGTTASVLRKGCLGLGTKVLAHEIGHTFSMPHTFGVQGLTEDEYGTPAPEGYEKIDGSNCTTAGDGFCDTSPDYLNYRWDCDDEAMSEFTLRDPDNVEFHVDGLNFMSYSDDYCSNKFSEEQSAAMRTYIGSELSSLIDNDFTQQPVSSSGLLSNANPVDGTEVDFENVTLEWDAIENVTHYTLEVSKQANFSDLIYKEVLTTTEKDISSNLSDEEFYYWRVGIYNLGYTCYSDWLATSTFSTGGVVSSASQIKSTEPFLQMFPNPVVANQNMQLQFISKSNSNINIKITDNIGRLVQIKTVLSIVGNNSVQIETDKLNSGLYWITIESNQAKISTKFIIL